MIRRAASAIAKNRPIVKNHTPSAPKIIMQLHDDCDAARKASYACLASHQHEREVCKSFFDAYKECVKESRRRVIEGRRQAVAEASKKNSWF